ncbi:ribonuclease J [Candidatus Peregrinibacteria bacterium]|nr:ribonuclease J [Candidatus Peregrinibacteria bacterium]
MGGLEEVGKNMNAFEYGDDIVIVDAGLSFGGPETLGIDYVIPDVAYLESKKRNIRAILFTHGHLDHIGGIPHVLGRLGNPPLYGSKLTMGLVKTRLEEFALDKTAKIHVITPDNKLVLGKFQIEFFYVNHSIPDSMGVLLKTPVGKVVHTGDFKFDHTPAMDAPANFQRIAGIGSQGIDVLMSDSTNAEKPGYALSEKVIGQNLDRIIADTKGRLIIASFSSLIGRIQQVCNSAVRYNRKVFISGRSMVRNIEMATELGYIKVPRGLIREASPAMNSLPPSQVLILTTGAQGEAMSALSRISLGEHTQIKIREGDTVSISASPIPGNEKAIVTVINNLHRIGAEVITNSLMDVHTSGHGHQEELKLMFSLIKPKHFIPIHGELFMMKTHAKLVQAISPRCGVSILQNGDIVEVNQQGARKSKQKTQANDIVIDGLGHGDLGSQVLQERKTMAQDGILIILLRAYESTKRLIGEPDIISRGLVYVKESHEIAQETKTISARAFEGSIQKNPAMILKELKNEIRLPVAKFIRKRLGREPLIIPIIMYI